MLTLAQSAGNRLADAGLQGTLLIFVILLIALTGLLAIILLLVMWRRYNARLSAPPTPPSQDGDPWATAGRRVETPEEDDDPDDEPEPREPR